MSTDAQGRDALRIFGSNNVTVDVTQLPGLPPPREVGGASAKNAMTYQWSTSEETTKALAAQTVLLDELHQEPKIEGGVGQWRDIDMNDTNTRLRIWSIMFDVYAQKSGNGLPDLMALIGRYLAAYTVHTGYNVPDFGESYLDKNEGTMPSDLAGRLERDCGVYALTVAYEVYRTAHGVKLPVTFRIWTTPDHASLVIRDDRARQFYVVNNNQVSVARGFDPANPDAAIRGEVAKAYAPIRGHTFTVSPAMDVELGSTALTDAQFRAQAWSRYQLAAGWTVEKFPAYQGHQPGRRFVLRLPGRRQSPVRADRCVADQPFAGFCAAAAPTDQLSISSTTPGPVTRASRTFGQRSRNPRRRSSGSDPTPLLA